MRGSAWAWAGRWSSRTRRRSTPTSAISRWSPRAHTPTTCAPRSSRSDSRWAAGSCGERLLLLVLGIETSCDETAAALVEDGRRVLSDVVSTQVDIHRRWGGGVPELARRNPVVQVMPVVHQPLARAGTALEDVELIAVTSGPGLVGALLVGLQVA